ncbi:MAG: hypothetical protein PHI35_09650 [Victivallaceae bacterium]|nr:hypothetical protein [Victivallaceae bacterium]
MQQITNTDYSDRNWIRSGGGVSQEERAAQPSDFTSDRGYAYAEAFANDGGSGAFDIAYPNWQAFADCFIMRRSVVTISCRQRCRTFTLLARNIEEFCMTGYTTLKNFVVADMVGGDSVPDGKWLNTGMSFDDERQGGYTSVTASYVQYRDWTLVKLKEDKLPNPAKA